MVDIVKLNQSDSWPSTPAKNTLYFKLVNGEEFEMRFSSNDEQDGFLTLLAERTVSRIVALEGSVIDCSQGSYFTKTIAGNTTFTIKNLPTGVAYSATMRLSITSGSITFPASFKWPGNTLPSFRSGSVYLLSFISEGNGIIRAAVLPAYSA